MRHCLIAMLAVTSLAGCESKLIGKGDVQRQLDAEVGRAAERPVKPAPPDVVSRALLPPMTIEMPRAAAPLEPRFDLVVNNAPANQVFMALVTGTRYSMLVHPDIKENLSLNLKDVTMVEVLEAVRELYGYEYKIQGTRVYIQPVTVQTRLFQVNYLAGQRVGRAEVRVSSGSIQTSGLPGALGAAAGGVLAVPVGGGTTSQSTESSRITTTSNNDFWAEIGDSIRTIIGADGGRNVVVNPTAG